MKPLTKQPGQESGREKTRTAAKAFTSMILAGSLASGGLAMAGCESCPLPGSCDTKDYPVELREGERIETISGQYPLRLEVIDITNDVQINQVGRCEARGGRATARLSVFEPGTTELGTSVPIHTHDFSIYPGSCVGIWDYCIRIEGTEAPHDLEQTAVTDPISGVVTQNCAISNERIKFRVSLNRGHVETPDGGYFQDGGSGGSDSSTGGSGGSGGSSDGGTGGS